jgi:hypothetical protein
VQLLRIRLKVLQRLGQHVVERLAAAKQVARRAEVRLLLQPVVNGWQGGGVKAARVQSTALLRCGRYRRYDTKPPQQR